MCVCVYEIYIREILRNTIKLESINLHNFEAKKKKTATKNKTTKTTKNKHENISTNKKKKNLIPDSRTFGKPQRRPTISRMNFPEKQTEGPNQI